MTVDILEVWGNALQIGLVLGTARYNGVQHGTERTDSRDVLGHWSGEKFRGESREVKKPSGSIGCATDKDVTEQWDSTLFLWFIVNWVLVVAGAFVGLALVEPLAVRAMGIYVDPDSIGDRLGVLLMLVQAFFVAWVHYRTSMLWLERKWVVKWKERHFARYGWILDPEDRDIRNSRNPNF